MVELMAAVRIVEDELEREYQYELSRGCGAIRTAVAGVRAHELVWIVAWDSAEYLRTGNSAHVLVGNGPYLVDRVDGGLHQVGVVSAKTGEWETDYRVRIRGETVRTAVDDLHDEVRAVAAARGRIHAMHVLRAALPALTLPQVVEYVTALTQGEAPTPLVALAVGELVPPVNPVMTVHTVTPPGR